MDMYRLHRRSCEAVLVEFDRATSVTGLDPNFRNRLADNAYDAAILEWYAANSGATPYLLAVKAYRQLLGESLARLDPKKVLFFGLTSVLGLDRNGRPLAPFEATSRPVTEADHLRAIREALASRSAT